MSDTLESLRARVEAAQALAAKATPGPWRYADASVYGPGDDDLLDVWFDDDAADLRVMAAAPDLVTLAADLLALAESQAAELTAIRTALGNGADESAWPPGLTVAQAVERLRGERTAIVAYLRAMPDSHRVGGQLVGTGYSPAAVRALADAADAIERGDFWPKGEALADDGGTRG